MVYLLSAVIGVAGLLYCWLIGRHWLSAQRAHASLPGLCRLTPYAAKCR
jgi:hypothetical protein